MDSTEQTSSPESLATDGSFNRAKPTTKGGHLFPASMCGYRKTNPDGTSTWVPPEEALGLPKAD